MLSALVVHVPKHLGPKEYTFRLKTPVVLSSQVSTYKETIYLFFSYILIKKGALKAPF